MRIGVIGWATETGLGYINHDMVRLGFASDWLVPAHPKLGIAERLLCGHVTCCRRSGDIGIYTDFIRRVDAIVFAERPVIDHFDIVAEARRQRRPICCIPQMEFMPRAHEGAAWVRLVTHMWAPTRWTITELSRIGDEYVPAPLWRRRVAGGQWGVDTNLFPAVIRSTCQRFLFCNGFGGVDGRKGWSVLKAAAQLAPSARIMVCSQRPLADLPSNCELVCGNVPNREELYQHGDVLVSPTRWEGLGLQLYEAQACGLPVIVTDGPPMTECQPWHTIPATPTAHAMRDRTITSYECDVQSLAALLVRLNGADISEVSAAAAARMRSQCDLRTTLQQLAEWLGK